MDKEVVKELIQHELTVNNIVAELEAAAGKWYSQSTAQEDYTQPDILSKAGILLQMQPKVFLLFFTAINAS